MALNIKICKIIPLYRGKGNKHCIENYRPISILNTLARIFETSLFFLIRDILKHKLSPNQHGVVWRKTTLTNLLNSYNHVYTNFDNKLPVDIVTINFSKAFDKVPHDLLLWKLSGAGQSNAYIKLLSNWLSNRFHLVKVGEARLQAFPVYCGVPQGSISSPIIFNVYVNGLYDFFY